MDKTVFANVGANCVEVGIAYKPHAGIGNDARCEIEIECSARAHHIYTRGVGRCKGENGRVAGGVCNGAGGVEVYGWCYGNAVGVVIGRLHRVIKIQSC